MEAARRLCGTLPNSVRIWAYIPHIGKLFLPFFLSFERDGLGSILPATLRFMITLENHRVHSATYLRAHHTALAQAAGLTQPQLDALAAGQAASSPLFEERERAAIIWAGEVARNTAKRNAAAYDALRKHYNDAEVVEITALCAISSYADLFYNALRVPVERPDELQALSGAISGDPERLRNYVNTLLTDWPATFPVPK
jgi:alkylhydroperoxidase family enzyme